MVDPLVNAFNTILVHEERHKKECIICPASNLVGVVLRLIQSKGYIGEIEWFPRVRVHYRESHGMVVSQFPG